MTLLADRLFSADPLSVARILAALVLVVGAAVVDVREGRIPNALTAAGGVVGLLLGIVSQTFGTAVLAAWAGGGALLFVRCLGHVLYRQPGMGWGDVKLGAALGAIAGWGVLWVLFLAAVVGSVVGLLLQFREPRKGPRRMVFAPFIAIGWGLSLVLPIPWPG